MIYVYYIATTTPRFMRPAAWDSDRLYPYGDAVGDEDLLAVLANTPMYWECLEVELNGLLGAPFFNKRHYSIYVSCVPNPVPSLCVFDYATTATILQKL